LRLLFAARPEALTRVLNVVARALSTAVVKRAGLSRSAGGETGIVTFMKILEGGTWPAGRRAARVRGHARSADAEE